MQILKQLAALQAKTSKIQEQLANTSFSGESGNGLVSVTVNGRGEILKLVISPAALSEDADLVSDLVTSAINTAMTKKEAESKKLLASIAPGLTGTGLSIPGFGTKK